MSLGFFRLAQDDPEGLALVDPSGREWSRGELLGACNRVTHGLRAIGLGKGDCIATVLPNSAEMIQLYLAAFQSGMYLTPINHHLTAPEIAYIVGDSDARVFVGASRFGDACRGAAEELGFARDRLFSIDPLD
ncbi:MAG: AMP-binding protein, partial [Deltaproteobacteria bacterium]